MNFFNYIYCFCFGLLLIAGKGYGQYNEEYRPQYHFSPKEGWIGDPDGLVHYKDTYHLFWWGHATSKDLVYWEEQPRPMRGGNGDFTYFSGSVAIDKENTAGFGKERMVAFYTKHFPGDSLPETQAISISKDGQFFDYYEQNPVLDIGKVFFRDPQVFWYAEKNKWIMVVSLPDVQKINIYESDNLKDWEFLSEFLGFGAQNSFWECPDLFKLKDENDRDQWVMFIGRGPNRVQYFLGDFDGTTFTPSSETSHYLKQGIGLKGTVFEDFETKNLENWDVKNSSFSLKENENKGSLGDIFLSSENLNEIKQAQEIRSADFKITEPAINFLIAGVDSSAVANFQLIVDGNVVKETSGTGSKVFKWKGWDVSAYIGKTAQLQLAVKPALKDSLYIAVDHIMFSDGLRNTALEHALWLDYGTDFYAARTWRDYDDKLDRTLMLGWLGNWDYAGKVPTSWGKGFESIPRELYIKNNRIYQKPIPALQKLRTTEFSSIEAFKPNKNIYEFEAIFDTKQEGKFGINIFESTSKKLVLSFNPTTHFFSVDRTHSTHYVDGKPFSEKFESIMNTVIFPDHNVLKLHVYVDQSSVEIFINDGEQVLSALVFPESNQTGISFFSEEDKIALKNFKAWTLSSIWKK